MKHIITAGLAGLGFTQKVAGAASVAVALLQRGQHETEKKCASTHKISCFVYGKLLQSSYLRGQNTPEGEFSYGKVCHSLLAFVGLRSIQLRGFA